MLRQAGTATLDSVNPALKITVDDVEVSETETRTQAAVALLVDTSFSMVMENRWLPMKQTALALNHLVTTRFRSDALQIIAFGRYARTVTAAELTGLEGVYEQGTNLHHALALAGRHLRRHPNAQPVVLVVTDGEPTAHLEDVDGDGSSVFLTTRHTRGPSRTPCAASTTWRGWARRSPSSGWAVTRVWRDSSTRSRDGWRDASWCPISTAWVPRWSAIIYGLGAAASSDVAPAVRQPAVAVSENSLNAFEMCSRRSSFELWRPSS